MRQALLLTLILSNQAIAATFAVQNVTIIDVDAGVAHPDTAIVVLDGVITYAGSMSGLDLPTDATLIDAAGQFAIPGLWDMHVHLAMSGETSLRTLFANGVTHVRDMGGPAAEVMRFRNDVATGKIVGPRILASGPILESARWLERAAGFLSEEEIQGRIGIADVAGVVVAIDAVEDTGADFVKLRTVSSRDIYLAIAAECRRLGFPLTGHAPPPAVSLQEAVEAGQRSFEHYLASPGIKPLPTDPAEFFAACKTHGVHFVPTIVSGIGFRLTPDDQALAIIADTEGIIDPRRRYIPPDLAASWKSQMEMKASERTKLGYAKIHADNLALFRRMHEAGVSLMAGTDLGGPLVYPGFSLHDELARFVEDLGMSPAEALRTATIVPAKFMQRDPEYGSIATGKKADVVLLRANPLERIEHVRDIVGIIHGDQYFDRAALDGLLDASP